MPSLRQALRVVIVVVASCIAREAAAETSPKPKNVLFVICDDLCCALGSYGDASAISPNIDALAKRGVLFERAYCQFPLCNPSRASMLTGRRPTTTLVNDNFRHFRKADPDTVTLPQAFRNAGAQVERIGKLYHYSVPNGIGTSGHDDPPSWDAVFNPKGRDVSDSGKIFSLVPGQFGGTVSWLAADGADAEQTDGIGAAHAVERLEHFAHDTVQKPFFLAVGFYRPHTPYVAPKPWFEKHPLDSVTLPVVPADHDAKVPAGAIGSRKKEQDRLVGELGREALQAYRASVSFVDAQVGIVVDALDRLGLADDTVIIFTSDHGYHLGEHGLWQKQSLFEQSARVPMVIVAPGGRAGVRTTHTVELIDVAPTLCELCGVPAPKGFEGRSLAPLVVGDDAALQSFPERPAFTEVDRGGVRGVSVRSGRWRYTVWNGGSAGRELYDHETDPHELDNLAGRREYTETIEKLEALVTEVFGKNLQPESSPGGKHKKRRPA
jgi:uncharacterized sulfatase